MADTPNVIMQKGGILEYQKKFGLKRTYPRSVMPKVQKRQLSTKEQTVLSEPLLKNARRDLRAD